MKGQRLGGRGEITEVLQQGVPLPWTDSSSLHTRLGRPCLGPGQWTSLWPHSQVRWANDHSYTPGSGHPGDLAPTPLHAAEVSWTCACDQHQLDWGDKPLVQEECRTWRQEPRV